MDTNIGLAYPDYITNGYWNSGVTSTGSWTTDKPLSNLKNIIRKKVARSTSAAATDTVILFDIQANREIQFVALLNHNITTSGSVRMKFYSDAACTVLEYDTNNLNVWPSSRPDYIALNGFIPDFWYVLPTHVHARCCLLEITDTTNAAGYVELGRFFMSAMWQPAINISYGCSVGWEDPDTTKERALGGADWFDQKAKRRAANVSFEYLTDYEAFHDVMEMNRRLGTSGELYFIFNPADTDYWKRQRSFLARMNSLSPLAIPNYGINTAGLNFTEVL